MLDPDMRLVKMIVSYFTFGYIELEMLIWKENANGNVCRNIYPMLHKKFFAYKSFLFLM